MAEKYNIGTQIRVVGKFKKFDGDPGTTTPVLSVMDPSENVSLPSVTTDKQAEDGTTAEVGTMFGDVTLDEAGLWRYRWVGSGAIIATDEGSFRVVGSQFP